MNKYIYYLIALISTLLALLLQWLDPPLISEIIEGKSYDLRMRLREKVAPRQARSDIQIVIVDEKSLKEVGRWPWSRDILARLVDGISSGKPRVIGIDILLSERESKERDDLLAASLKRANNVVLATGFMVSRKNSAIPKVELQAPDFLWDSAFMEIRAVDGIDWKKYAVTSDQVIPPLRELATASVLGHVTTIPDMDGSLRWDILPIRFGDEVYPSLSLQVARVASHLTMQQIALYGGTNVKFGDRFISTDLSGRVIINYTGEEGRYRYVSACDVLSGRISSNTFKDSIVLVGTSALGTYDQKVSPLSGNLPGVEKNATVVQNILENSFIRKNPRIVEVSIILLTGIILALVLPQLNALWGVCVGFGLVIIYSGIACWLLFYRDLWVTMVLPVGNMLVIMTVETITKLFTEERQAREIRKMFSSYVSPKIVDILVNNPELARPGGHRREVTIMFADIIGFTTISEKLRPEEVVDLLNEYYKEMANIIFRWDGTLDKFVGDEIMAIWGAPLDQPNHAELAVRCALHMSDCLDKLREGWRKRGLTSIDCGIGINTGEVLIGNIGLEGKKMDYTAIGNNVNIAARVEKLTREHDSRILITDNTLVGISAVLERNGFGHLEMQERGEVLVKGKEVPVKIIALQSIQNDM